MDKLPTSTGAGFFPSTVWEDMTLANPLQVAQPTAPLVIFYRHEWRRIPMPPVHAYDDPQVGKKTPCGSKYWDLFVLD